MFRGVALCCSPRQAEAFRSNLVAGILFPSPSPAAMPYNRLTSLSSTTTAYVAGTLIRRGRYSRWMIHGRRWRVAGMPRVCVWFSGGFVSCSVFLRHLDLRAAAFFWWRQRGMR